MNNQLPSIIVITNLVQLEVIIINAISSQAANELQKYELTWTGCLWFMQLQDQESYYPSWLLLKGQQAWYVLCHPHPMKGRKTSDANFCDSRKNARLDVSPHCQTLPYV